MIIVIDGITIYFNYKYIYPEQYQYMCHLVRLLKDHGSGLLEMPCGTGKTISLLSVIISMQLADVTLGKLIYCSRTIPEIEHVLTEVESLLNYIKSYDPKLVETWLAIGLSSRRKLCANGVLNNGSNTGVEIDSGCLTLTMNGAGGCSYYNKYKDGAQPNIAGVYTLEQMKEHASVKGICPYYYSRQLLSVANIIVYSFQYLLSPKVFAAISKEFPSASIVVFDEAHNMDSLAMESMTQQISRAQLDLARQSIETLQEKTRLMETEDKGRLDREYNRLLSGLKNRRGITIQQLITDVDGDGDEDNNEEEDEGDIVSISNGSVVPGHIRKSKHFLHMLERFCDYLTIQLDNVRAIRIERPAAFTWRLGQQLSIANISSLKWTSRRLRSVMKTLKIIPTAEYRHVRIVGDMISLLSSITTSQYSCITYPIDDMDRKNSNTFQLCCIDPSIAISPIFAKFRNIVITSATLSPLPMYPRLLSFQPRVVERLHMTCSRTMLLPIVVGKGNDQSVLSTRYRLRDDLGVLRNYAQLLLELCCIVPDGVIAFFPSYLYLEHAVCKWNELGLLARLLEKKLLFVETVDRVQTSAALQNFRLACDCGRGALLLCVARGKVSEGIDFTAHYGRCVIVIGMPYQYTRSAALLQRLDYMKQVHSIKPSEYLTFDAMRQTSQCMGRNIRSKSDYSIMIFADDRYAAPSKLNKLPEWIANSLSGNNVNVSVDVAVSLCREFLRKMAQPYDPQQHVGHDLWLPEHIK